MTTPRSQQIDLAATPYYHCVSRCVRKAYLCGYDKETKRNLDHRKQWLIDRIKFLASLFYIDIAAYAIMDNHYHLVLHVDYEKANKASSDEILRRWETLYPTNANLYQTESVSEEVFQQKIIIWRERFSNISFFMKLLNENIAKRANEEDKINGRFWQGRFKSQALLDDGAVLAAMVYVDLNPIRAKTALTPETSTFTSIHERIQAVAKDLKQNSLTHINVDPIKIDNTKQPPDLMAFINSSTNGNPSIEYTLSEYLSLVDETGRIIRDDQRGSIPERSLPLFERLNLNPTQWIPMVKNIEIDFGYSIGSAEMLSTFGHTSRSNSHKGLRRANIFYRAA